MNVLSGYDFTHCLRLPIEILVHAYTSFEFNFRFVCSLIKQDNNTKVGLGTLEDIGDEKQNE